MLKKKERLNRETFNRFFASGKRFHSPSLTLIYHPHTGLSVSAVAPKKVGKTAVLRNKFRRRVYEIFKKIARESKIQGVYIVLAKQGGTELPFETLKEELKSIIHKSNSLG